MIDYTLFATFLMGMLLGVGMGLLIAAHVHHCPPFPTLAQQESTAVALYKASLVIPSTVPHAHQFSELPNRSEPGWRSWDCVVCGQEYSSTQRRLKREVKR